MLVRAERLVANKNFEAALKTMDEIVALQKEHNLTLPEEFHFKYAQVALSAGSNQVAMESAKKYLMLVGKTGEFYREALELLDAAEHSAESTDATVSTKEAVDFINTKLANCWKPQFTFRGISVSSDYMLNMSGVTYRALYYMKACCGSSDSDTEAGTADMTPSGEGKHTLTAKLSDLSTSVKIQPFFGVAS